MLDTQQLPGFELSQSGENLLHGLGWFELRHINGDNVRARGCRARHSLYLFHLIDQRFRVVQHLLAHGVEDLFLLHVVLLGQDHQGFG